MTVSWASVAGCKPSQPSSDAAAPGGRVEAIGRTAVLDANALIMGVPLTTMMADRVVTVPEVLEEVRDKRSRQAVAALPYTIETIEPVEDSISAGNLP
jgi:RNA-binding protein NOB1